MKLRQKLAAVLAATMVVTAVPVVTMAASTSGVTKVVTVTNTDKSLGELDQEPKLKVELKDIFTGSEFYLQLDGAEWKDTTTAGLVTVEGTNTVLEFHRLDKKEAKIVVPAGTTVAKGDIILVNLKNAIVKADEATVIVDGNNSEITDAKVVFARKQTGALTATAGTATTFYTGVNSIADITIEESIAGQLVEGKYEFDLSLDSRDFDFVKGAVTVEGTRGLNNADVTLTGEITDVKDNTATLVVEIDTNGNAMSRGGIKVKGIKVEDNTDSPTLGEIKMDIAGSSKKEQDLMKATELKVAEVSAYGATLDITKKDDKLVEVGNGKQAEVTFALKETTQDSFGNRDVDFVLENGFFAEDAFETTTTDKTTTTTIEVKYKNADNKEVTEDVQVEKIYKDKTKKKETEIIGFTLRLVGSDAVKEAYTFKDVKVNSPINAEGDITLTVEGRGINETVEATLATVKNEFTVSNEAMNVEVGVRSQKGGKIVLKEEEKGTFARGEYVEIILPADEDLTFKAPKVSATGDMIVSLVETDGEKITEVKNDKNKVTGYKVTVKVDRVSKEAGEIVIEDFEVATDRAAADASYDVKVKFGGSTKRSGEITVADFFVVGEGITTKVTTTITNGATEMVVNGKKVALDAPAFLEKGKMMVPLRAVAEAFGINSKDIVYNAGEIVIFANGRTIALTIGSTDAYVNGAKMTLANPAKIVNERTTVPVGDMARLLGVKVEWDNTTKTATFNN